MLSGATFKDSSSDSVDNDLSEESDFQSLSASFTSSIGSTSTTTTPLQSGRQRRRSKKQKRKRKTHFRTTYLEEFYNLGNLVDVTDDIENVFSDIAETGTSVNVQRRVPSLVELCLVATRRKRLNSVPNQKKPLKFNISLLPSRIRGQLRSWGQTQKELQGLLSYLQNQILPIFIYEDNKVIMDDKFYQPFVYENLLKRSVFSEIANPSWTDNTQFCEKYSGFLMSGTTHRPQDELSALSFTVQSDFVNCMAVLVSAISGKK